MSSFVGLNAVALSDNAELVVSNQTFFANATTTFACQAGALRRGSVMVGIDYKHDPDAVIALLVATAKSNPRVLTDPLTNGGISSELRRAIGDALRDNGIEMPYPQQVNHWAPTAPPF
jgi:small-conductance mechanosensitive channel